MGVDTSSLQPKKLAALCGGLASRVVREVPQLSASFPRGLGARGAPRRALRFAVTAVRRGRTAS